MNKIIKIGIGIIGLLFLVGTYFVLASPDSEGPNSPGTMADDAAVGTLTWSNPDNAKVSDSSYASALVISSVGITHYLKATNFGFTIPSGATIDGILVEIERKASGQGTVTDEFVKIVKADGSIGSENKADVGTQWTTEEYASYGASDDLWSESWTAENINDADFGVVVSADMWAQEDRGMTAYVNHIRITVYYTEAPPPSPLLIIKGSGRLKLNENGRLIIKG